MELAVVFQLAPRLAIGLVCASLGRVDQGRCRPQPPQIRTCGFFRIRLLDGWLRYARAAEWMAVIRGRGYRARRRRNRFHGIDLFCDRRLSHFCQMWTT